VTRLRPVIFDDPKAFRDRVFPLLLQDEARSNLMIGIVTTLVEHPEVYQRKLLMSIEDDEGVVAAALTTPPFQAVVSDLSGAATVGIGDVADVVALALIEHLPGVVGVLGNVPVAEAVARAWERHAHGAIERRFVQGVYAVSDVIAPPRAPGALRAAEPDDRELVARWYVDFNTELRLDHSVDVAVRLLESRLRGEGGGVDLWERDGQPVSLAAYATTTPNGARIGPVYTPPAHRGKGYAHSLVAETTARLLAHRSRFCFLYTDLANPTSNRLYQDIGYRQVCVAEDWRFTSPAQRSP